MSVAGDTVLARLVGACAVGIGLQEPAAPSRVVLPQQDLLVVDEFGALGVDQFAAEMFVLEKIEKIQAHGVFQELGVVGFLPVLQVLEVVYERVIFEVVPLGQNCNEINKL